MMKFRGILVCALTVAICGPSLAQGADTKEGTARPISQWDSPYSMQPRAPVGEVSPVAAEQLIDMGSYSLRAPLGEGWKLLADRTLGTAMFMKGPPDGDAGWVVVTQSALRSEVDLSSEAGAAARIQQYEEASLWARGATRSYAPGKISRGIETYGEKRLYVMRYAITDHSRGFPIEVMYATCVYLPPNAKETRRVYLFIVGKVRNAAMSADANVLPELSPVIASLREK